jgi:hypothetical protein
MLNITVDDTVVMARLDSMPAKVHAAVLKKTYELALRLKQKVKANLKNVILRYRTGELYGSMFNEVTDSATSVTGMVASSASSKAAPYAYIQEYGGTTKAHVIEAVNAKALLIAKEGSGGVFYGSFFKRVNHPGSTIPPHRYLGSAFDEMKPEIQSGYEQAAQEGTA